jgi:nucleotide-binding universal stress UspA family protein
MIRNLLVATDGSPQSAVAVDCAFSLAHRLYARLEAVHVIDSRLVDLPMALPAFGAAAAWSGPQASSALHAALQARGEAILRELEARAEKEEIPVETHLEFGNPAQVIRDIQQRTELVVLGRAGEHAVAAPGMTGSTMDRVVHRAIRPCLVTPPAFAPIRKILFATDGGAAAARARDVATDLAQALSVPMVVLSVATRASGEERARTVVENALSSVRAHETAAAGLALAGNPAAVILEQAKKLAADLVVLGMHGHGKMYDRLLGSTAAIVNARAACPVLLVP